MMLHATRAPEGWGLRPGRGVRLRRASSSAPRRAPSAAARSLVAIFQRGAVDGLSMVVPHGDPGLRALSRAASRSPRRDAGDTATALDLDGFFGLHPALAPLKPLWDEQDAGRRARLRLARHHPLALRRAGLHGERHARREEHARRLAGPRPRRRCRHARPRRSDRSRSASRLPRSLRGDAGALAMSSLDRFDVAARRDGGGPPRLRVALRRRRAGPAARHRTRDLRGGEAAQERGRRPALSRPTAPSTRADASARRCGRSPSSSAPTSGSRSPSPRSRAGTRTWARAPSRAS